MSMPYWVALQYAELPSLSDRRDKLCRYFFRKLLNLSNCIQHPPRDTEITSRLRRETTYPRPRNCTNCYKSFIHHALLKCHRPISLSLVYCCIFHCIALHFISCLVLFCCTVHYSLFSFLIFSLLATSSTKLSLNLKTATRRRDKPAVCELSVTTENKCCSMSM